MRELLVVSDDYWGARAEASVQERDDVLIAVDRSGGLIRALKLVLRRSVPLRAAIYMWLAQRSLPQEKPNARLAFSDNAELRSLAEREQVTDIVLFRAGLIISGKTLENCHVRNIHCADIDGFGGLASIFRAIRAGAFHQTATLHTVTNRIDEGEVLDVEPFELDPKVGYAANENRAYEAGIRLLVRTLGGGV
ncbi:formyltransferase family protein [Hoeflea sp. AS60]|uniref:formyltransferase family protein n=1 Tax=Hoeflea sp. AS60 TaxID=3135780 RepID=UPI00316E9572